MLPFAATLCADDMPTRQGAPDLPRSPSDPEIEAGTVIDGKYRITGLLGTGGMGTVYSGVNTSIGRKVALKVLHPSIAHDSLAVRRFEREAKAAARAGSTHVVDILDVGSLPNGARYLVMEYLEGESLQSRLARRGVLDAREAGELALQILEGLGRMHAAGIVHRDLKPANVYLVRSHDGDFVKILDFGVCKIQAVDGSRDTASGALLGTPDYMAPEQVDGGAVDARTDLYAVGVMLYHCVAGRFPYEAESRFSLLMRKLAKHPPLPVAKAAPGLDAAFAEIITKAIALDPADRYASSAEMRDDIARGLGRVDRLLADFLDLRHVPIHAEPRVLHTKARASSGVSGWWTPTVIVDLSVMTAAERELAAELPAETVRDPAPEGEPPRGLPRPWGLRRAAATIATLAVVATALLGQAGTRGDAPRTPRTRAAPTARAIAPQIEALSPNAPAAALQPRRNFSMTRHSARRPHAR